MSDPYTLEARHDARVAELLASNNALLERARKAEAAMTGHVARPDDPWEWYVTTDEECWTLAEGCATRDDAIAYGRDAYGGDSFNICEARKGHFDLGLDANDLDEWVCDRSEEQLGEDQDSIFEFPPVGVRADLSIKERLEAQRLARAPARDALKTYIENAVRRWARDFGVTIDRPWAFAATRNTEAIAAIAVAVSDDHV